MPREETAGESLRERIMEGSLRAVDRTASVMHSRLQRFFHVTGKQYSILYWQSAERISEIRWYRGFSRPKLLEAWGVFI